MNKISVVTVDDHPLIRRAIAGELEEQEDMALVAEGCSGDDVLALVQQHRPDVLLLDLNMPRSIHGDKNERFHAFPTIARLRDEYPETAVVVLTQHLKPLLLQGALAQGVSGYLLKGDDLSLNLSEAVRAASKGGMYLSETAHRFLDGSRTHPPEYVIELRPRQMDVLNAIFSNPNASYSELAELLEITESTFKAHLSNVFSALGVNNATAAVLRCIELGIMEPGAQEPS
jgi:DNA-binding NarL/FixJ family response regulator